MTLEIAICFKVPSVSKCKNDCFVRNEWFMNFQHLKHKLITYSETHLFNKIYWEFNKIWSSAVERPGFVYCITKRPSIKIDKNGFYFIWTKLNLIPCYMEQLKYIKLPVDDSPVYTFLELLHRRSFSARGVEEELSLMRHHQ